MLPGLAPALAYPLPDLQIGGTAFDGTTQTTYTFAACSIPHPPCEGRRVFAMIVGDLNGGSRSLSSATIGGVAAAIHALSSTLTAGATELALVSAIVPTGTTAVVVPTFSTTCDRALVRIASAVGLKNASPTGTIAPVSALSSSAALADIEDAIILCAASNRGSAGPSFTWTNATEFEDTTFDTNKTFSSATVARVPQGETTRTITALATTGLGRLVGLSWR